MRLALAQVPHPTSFQAGLDAVLAAIAAAGAADARVICFPECCLKGMRGTGFPVEAITVAEHDRAIEAVRRAAAAARVHVILPTERPGRAAPDVWHNGAWVIDADGTSAGYQTKNQIPVEEEPFFAPGTGRRLFHLDGVPVSIVICHEGWRYPETVRWGATRGAQIVFHPHFGGEPAGNSPPPPGETFWDKAMVCRAAENTVWFASVNFALPVQISTTSLISPDGERVAAAPLRAEALVIADLDPALGTGFLARRLAPERYGEG